MKQVARTQLVEARKRRQWSQQEVADLLGTTQHNVSRWERGQTVPGPYFRAKLCELFGTSAEELGVLGDPANEAVLHPPLPHSPPLPAPITPVSSTEHHTSLWQVPYPRNPFFTGRDRIVQEVHAILHQERTAILSQSYALSGLGGIGKTQTALEYVYRYAQDYTAVFWISAETTESLITSFCGLADLLNLPEKDDQEQQRAVTAVLRWLTSHEGWLLIYDNIEALDIIKSYVPSARQGALLFTARKQALGMSGHTLNLETLRPEEGLRFLLHRARLLDPTAPLEQANPTEVTAAREIVTAMDGLPLALDQAGAYIEATHCTLSDYLALLQVAPLRLLDEREPSAEHPLSVTRTFALAFEQLERSHPQAGELLTACAFLAPEAIPDTFFLEGATQLGPPFEALAADPLQFQAALKILLSYSLLQRQATPHTLTVHRLVQAVLKDRLSEAAQRGYAERIIHAMTALFPTTKVQSNYRQTSERLLPHALTCITLSEQWSTNAAVRVALMNHVAHYCFNRAQFTEAKQLYHQALHVAEQALEPEHPQTAEAIDGLATLYSEQENYAEAESLHLRALHMREQTLGPENLLVADSLHNLATLYVRQGNYAEAEPLHLRALRMREQTLGPEALLVALSLNNLAIIYLNQKRYSEAEQLYQRTLRIREQALGPEDPLLLNPCTNLGQIYREQGKFAEAEGCFRRALHLGEQGLGPEHPQLTHVLNGLAVLLTEQGKYSEAERLYQRALRITEQAFGLEHPRAAQLFFGLAELLKEQGSYAEAKRFYQRVLSITEQAFGTEHFMQTYPLCGLAEIHRIQGNYEQAEQLFQHAWQIWERMEDGEHPDKAYILSGRAKICVEQTRYAEAESLYARALHLREHHLGPDHPLTAETLLDLADLYTVQGKRSEGLPLLQRALAIRERVFGAEHPRTVETRTMHTELLRAMGRQEEAAQTEQGTNTDERTIHPKEGL